MWKEKCVHIILYSFVKRNEKLYDMIGKWPEVTHIARDFCACCSYISVKLFQVKSGREMTQLF